MKPFAYKMTPAYRHAQETPWGGDALRTLYGKAIPDALTGESAGSLHAAGARKPHAGRRAAERNRRGQAAIAAQADRRARERLSVQVHPDDALAAQLENGKTGKEEAWLILHAKPGAKLVYGLLPGTDLAALTGETIEAALRYVPVAAGDVVHIPCRHGTRHRRGESCSTRSSSRAMSPTASGTGANSAADGKPRPLHWDKACLAAKPALAGTPVRGVQTAVPGGVHTQCLRTPHFALDKFLLCRRAAFAASRLRRFPVYHAALGHRRAPPMGRETLPLRAGETAFVPEGVGSLFLQGALRGGRRHAITRIVHTPPAKRRGFLPIAPAQGGGLGKAPFA